ncbi:MAG: tRNA 2-thiouridine(34) synthase MnmA [Deltaproteobacteria bacterium]|nr:tRNA 2-thiouridine(34) synthase MnmA [Deltaproteobacteria bacterium]
MRKKAIAVAISGGIDSACASAILKEEGWEVVGIHLVLPLPLKQREEKLRNALLVSRELNIALYPLDVRNFFQKRVIDYFTRSYSLGLTPNPCVVCNYVVKFGQIIKWMDNKRIDYLATGHYARVTRSSNKRYIDLLKGKDRQKDQSYFLHRLGQSHLSKTLFPLGDMTKAEIYKEAEERGLSASIHPESQEICFIPDNNYRSFLKSRIDKSTLSQGDIIDLEGNVLGVHSGTYAYTIGQRQGLGISSREPLYVCQIRPETNEIVVGTREALFTATLTAEEFNWIGIPRGEPKLRVQAQIRYRHEPADGTLTIISPDIVHFEFDTPQWAITPGQAFVCYEGEKVLGGGWISVDRTQVLCSLLNGKR